MKKSLLWLFKELLHPLPKISMFCALSHKIINTFWKIIYASESKLSKEFKNSIKI